MLNDVVITRLKAYVRPITLDDFKKERPNLKDRPDDVLSKMFTNQQRAGLIMDSLGVNPDSSFYKAFKKYWEFPRGRGEEISAISVIEEDARNSFWEEEYPDISQKFLQLSSIEGEGSYFYEIATDSVFDVAWGDDFLNWYYSDSEINE